MGRPYGKMPGGRGNAQGRQQRKLEPPAMLVGTFQVQIDGQVLDQSALHADGEPA